MTPKLHALFADYEKSHQHPVNRMLHKVAIPLIAFHIAAMLDWIRLASHLTVGGLVYVGVALWYVSMDRKLGLLVSALLALCFPLGWVTPRPAVIAVALVGWLVQLAGHVVWEKKSPSFMHNLLHALVGPMYFIALLTGDWRTAASAGPRANGAKTP